jgi:hypothetical protein
MGPISRRSHAATQQELRRQRLDERRPYTAFTDLIQGNQAAMAGEKDDGDVVLYVKQLSGQLSASQYWQ